MSESNRMFQRIAADSHTKGIFRRATRSIWAMLPEAIEPAILRAMEEDYEPEPLESQVTLYTDSVKLSSAGPDTYVLAEPQAAIEGVARVSGQIAVVPIRGTIDQRQGFWTETSTDELQSVFGRLAGDPNVGAIVLDVDSPGGVVFGVPETAEYIRGLRKAKPIYGLADSVAASAAYWLASAASKLYVTPSGQVGSIGVWGMHVDLSKFLDEMGWKVTLISAGKYKVEGNPFEELSAEARDDWQGEVDRYYGMFVDAVAANRRRKSETVRNGFGEGRMVMAEAAVRESMADGIATLPQLLGALVSRRRGNTAQAELAIERARD